MKRKQIRLRKEYLYQKEQEQKQEKKVLNKDCEYEEEFYQDPKLLITTSRKPSDRLKKFHKEVSSLFPNSTTVNRGGYKLKDIHEFGIKKGFSDIVLIHEYKGEPKGLVISHLPIGPTVYFGLQNVIMRHDVDRNSQDNISLAYPHLVFENFNEKIGARLKKILQHLFPIPLNNNSKRVVSFLANKDLISFRHHIYEKPTYNKVELYEMGPRFELRPYMIRLGTLLNANATVEWSIKAHINTATKNLQVSLD